MDKPEKLKLKTEDLTNENVEKLGELFPDILTEVEKDGKLIKKIDLEKLKELVGDFADKDSEIYQLTWAGKQNSKRVANEPTTKTLRPVIADSVDFENTENLYIEGDNLEVLKILRKSYTNSIKAIYIDPPYNTRKDFVYKDNFSMSKEDYEAEAGAVDEEGNRLIKNTGTDGRFHSNWLNMMYPRLQLAYKLLKKDGVIFISINSIELSNLKKIMDEIFGESNFLQLISVKSATTASFRSINLCPVNVSEYILMYAKDKDSANISPVYVESTYSEDYSHIIINPSDEPSEWKLEKLDNVIYQNEGVSDWKEFKSKYGDNWKKIRYELKSEYALQNKDFVVSLNTLQKPSADIQKLIDESKQIKGKVFQYARKDLDDIYAYNGRTFAFLKNKIKVIEGKESLAEILTNIWDDISFLSLGHEGKVYFNNGKKPIKLIQRILDLSCSENDIIMDFFSGSASSGHAVFEDNLIKSKNNKFILIQLDEDLDKSLESADIDNKKTLVNTIKFLDSINKPHILSEIGKERLRRASSKLKEQSANNLSQKKLTKGIQQNNVDFGFRVFRLDESNMKDEFYQNLTQSTLLKRSEMIKPDRTEDDLIYQTLLDMGVKLSQKVVKKSIDNKNIFVVDDDFLVGCFDENITQKAIDEIVKIKPLRLVFKETCFKTDADMINAMEVFKHKIFDSNQEQFSNNVRLL